MALVDEDWSEEQARAVLDTLGLTYGIPQWKPHHLKRFQEWCDGEGKNSNTLDSQLEFVAHDLCYEHDAIGMALKLARTFQEAKDAIKPYGNLLREESDWYRKPHLRRV